MNVSLDFAGLAQLAFGFCVIAILEGIAVYTWQFRHERGALWHIWAQTSKCLWLAAIIVFNLGVSGIWREAIDITVCVMAVVSIYVWYRFFAELSGFDRVAPLWLEPAIRIGTLLCCALYLSNPWHHLVWRSVIENGVLVDRLGPMCILTYIFGYSVNLLSVTLNVRWALGCRGLRRRQAWAFLAPAVILWSCDVLSSTSWTKSFDPHALSFLLAGLVTAWAFFRWRSYSVLPLAQEAMLHSMIDGLVVVDEDGYVVRLNTAAHSTLPGMNEGVRFENVASASPELATLRAANSPQVLEASWEIDGSRRFFQVQTTPLYAAAGLLLGQVFSFKDITQEKLQQARIVEQEKAISLLKERTRISRELHDGQGQSWSYVAMQLCAIDRRMEQGEMARAVALLKELRSSVQDTHLDLRETITALHIGRDTLRHGLLHAIEDQLNWYRAHCGWQARIEIDCVWREDMLAPQSKVQLICIVQEALANARRHAQATSVRIVFDCREGVLCLTVKDNGRGFDLEESAHLSGHHGLRMMRERAEEIGAELRVESNHDSGASSETSITVLLPFDTGTEFKAR